MVKFGWVMKLNGLLTSLIFSLLICPSLAFAITTTVTFDLRDSQGNTFSYPSGVSDGTIWCSAGMTSGSASLTAGDSSKSIDFNISSNTTLQCIVTLSGNYASADYYNPVSLIPGQAASATIAILPLDASAVLSFFDVHGDPFPSGSPVQGSASCTIPGTISTPSRTFTASVSSADTSVTVPILSGRSYTCTASLSDTTNGWPGVQYHVPTTSSFTTTSSSSHPFTVGAFAKDSEIEVNLRDSSNNPLNGGMSGVYSCVASSVGHTASLSFYNQSSVTIQAISGAAYTCSVGSISGYETPASQTVTPVSGSKSTLNFSYATLPQGVTANLLDLSGSAFAVPTGYSATLNCNGPGTWASRAINVGDSSATLGLAVGSYSCSVSVYPTTGYEDRYIVPGWATANVTSNTYTPKNFNVTHLDSSIRATLKDHNDNYFPAPNDMMGLYMSCNTTDNSGGAQQHSRSITFSGTPTPQHSSSTFAQSGRTYSCTGPDREGYSVSGPHSVSPVSGQESEVVFTYTPLAQNLTVALKDKDGNSLPATGMTSVSCSKSGGGGYYSKTFTAGSSTKTWPIATGTYTCSINGPAGYKTLGSKEVTIVNAQDKTLTFTLFAEDASLHVDLVDAQGNSVQVTGSSWFNCSAYGDGYNLSSSVNITSGNSSADLNLIGGYTYSCSLQPFGNYSSGNFSIAVPVGGTASKVLTLLEKNAPLKVKLVSTNGNAVVIPSGSSSAYVSCWSSSGGSYISGQIGVGESEVTMLTVPSTYSCYASVSGFNVKQSYNQAVRTEAGSTAEYSVTIEVRDSTINLQFKDQAGAAVAVPSNSSWAQASCWSREGGSYTPLSIGATSAQLQVVGGRQYYCSAYGITGYVEGSTAVEIGAAETKTLDLIFKQLDSTITVNLTNTDGTPYVVPDSSSAGVSCYSANFGNYKSVSSGSSSATVEVLGGFTYKCSTWIPNMATVPNAVTVSNNGSASVNLVVSKADAPVTIRLVDSAGNLISGAEDVVVGAWSATEQVNHGMEASFENGIASLTLVRSNKYTVYAYSNSNSQQIYGLIKAGSDRYFNNIGELTIEPPASGSFNQDITLKLANATVSLSSGGAPGWFNIQPQSANPTEWLPGISGSVSTSSISVPAPAGSYDVLFYPENSSISPKPQTLTIATGETKAVSFQVLSEDLTLRVLGSVANSESGGFYCNAFTPDGLTANGSDASFNNRAEVKITSTAPSWTISCQGWSDASEKIYKGSATFEVPSTLPSNGQIDVTVNLEEKGALLKGTTTGSSDSPLSVPVGGDTTLSADTGTFPSGQTVTVEVNNKGTAPETTELVPDEVFDFSALDGSNNPVTADKGVTFQVPLEDGQTIFGYSSTGGYEPLPTSEVSSSGSSLSAFASQTLQSFNYSIFAQTTIVNVTVSKAIFNSGVVVKARSRAASGNPTPAPSVTPTPAPKEGTPSTTVAPSKPTKLKLAKGKKNKKGLYPVTATWSAASGATSYTVVVMAGSKKIKTLTVTAAKATFTGLKKGTYKVIIKSVNSAGSSAATQAQVKL